MAFDLWQREGIHHAHVVRGEHEVNGTALNLVYAHGDNSIVVYPGAGAGLTPGHVLAAQPMLACAKVVVASCEVPLPAAQLAFEVARQHGVLTLLNPATAIDIPDALWPLVDVLVLMSIILQVDGLLGKMTGTVYGGAGQSDWSLQTRSAQCNF